MQYGGDISFCRLYLDLISECNKRFIAISIVITRCFAEKETQLSYSVEQFSFFPQITL